MLPVSLIFTSGVASGVNSYAAVLVLGLLGRFGHIAAIPPVLERPPVLAAAAALYIGQFVVGKIPMLDSVWDVVHTALRPVVGGAVGVVMAQHAQANSAATIAAAALGGGAALASHVVKTSMRVGVNASPEPFSNIAASLLEDLGVAGLVSSPSSTPPPRPPSPPWCWRQASLWSRCWPRGSAGPGAAGRDARLRWHPHRAAPVVVVSRPGRVPAPAPARSE